VDLEGLSQEEAGERMGVSRGTAWRLVQSARKKIAQASPKEDRYALAHLFLNVTARPYK
jgi:predicted DNA-binding protein (UPF0251 family)